MRTLSLGILLLAVSCAPPPDHVSPSYPSLDQVRSGDTPEQVTEMLGKTTSRENGWWWIAGIRYSTDYQVWNYKGVGRVIFYRGSRTVVASEADPYESGDGGDDLM